MDSKRAVAGAQEFLRDGNHVYSSRPLPQPLTDLLADGLTTVFQESKRVRGRNVRVPETKELYTMTDDGRIGFPYGLWSKARGLLRDHGEDGRLYRIDEVDEEKNHPQWDRIEHDPHPRKTQRDRGKEDPYRYRQFEVIEAIASNWQGCIDMPVAGGKGFIIRQVCRLFPKLKIDVVVRGIDVLKTRLYPEISSYVRDCGITGDGNVDVDRRVTLYSADSLHHSRFKADMLLIDEVHECAADRAAANLSKYWYSRNYGFSGSHDLRNDAKNIRVEALCGPKIFTMEYQEAADNDLVVPIEVHWTTLDYSSSYDDIQRDDAFKRRAVWTNVRRNQAIASVARSYDDDVQTLIAVQSIEHAIYLKSLLPEFQLIYSPAADTDKLSVVVDRLGFRDWQWLTKERKEDLAYDFLRGRFKKAIATGVWKKGVDFPQLSVVIRAEAAAIPIDDVQFPGRAARVSPQTGKTVAYVHDFIDKFSERLARNSTKRHGTYRKLRWKQFGWNQRAAAS